MTAAEKVYLGRSNTIDLVLKANGVAVDLTSVSVMRLAVGNILVTSLNEASDPIRWNQLGYVTGECRMALGSQDIGAGTYQAELIVYDPTNPLGVDWGKLLLTFVEDPVTGMLSGIQDEITTMESVSVSF